MTHIVLCQYIPIMQLKLCSTPASPLWNTKIIKSYFYYIYCNLPEWYNTVTMDYFPSTINILFWLYISNTFFIYQFCVIEIRCQASYLISLQRKLYGKPHCFCQCSGKLLRNLVVHLGKWFIFNGNGEVSCLSAIWKYKASELNYMAYTRDNVKWSGRGILCITKELIHVLYMWVNSYAVHKYMVLFWFVVFWWCQEFLMNFGLYSFVLSMSLFQCLSTRLQ